MDHKICIQIEVELLECFNTKNISQICPTKLATSKLHCTEIMGSCMIN